MTGFKKNAKQFSKTAFNIQGFHLKAFHASDIQFFNSRHNPY